MVSIRIENVTKRFGDTVAVEGVSLDVRKGELFFLLGPSGCGKTTLLRIVAGLCDPDEGDIYFGEKKMTVVPAHRRNAAMVFQNYALWPHMNVAANVRYGLEEAKVPRRERQKRVEWALKTVRMAEQGDRMPNQLSGGQQQRIALARALVVQPDAILLDEPLSNLDAKLRLEMRDEIRRIHEETGITMLYVTHDQKEALSMADRVAVMSLGRVEQVGAPREVYRHPANRFVAGFIGEANFLRGTFLSAENQVGTVSTNLGRFRGRVGPRVPDAGSPVVCMVRPESLRLTAGLENAFRALVRDCVYLGETEQFILEAAGEEMRVVKSNPGETGPRVGGEVPVCFAPADMVILPEDQR